MNKRWWMGVLAFSIGLNLMLAGAWLVEKTPAQPRRDEKREKAAHFLEVPPEQLKLTARQLEQWESIRKKQERESLDMRRHSLERLERLGNLLTSPDMTTQSLHRLIGEMNAGEVDYAARILEGYLRQREILNQVQEQQLRTLLLQRIARIREWSQRRYEGYLKDLKERYGEEFVSGIKVDTTMPSHQ